MLNRILNETPRRGVISRIFLCAIFLSGAVACASNPSAPGHKPTMGDAPAIWRVYDEDNSLYLFGTLHILPDGVDWRTPAFHKAMAEAAFTMTEADTKSPQAIADTQAAVAKNGFNPPGVALSELLGADRFAAIAEIAQSVGVSAAGLEPMQPWLALITITQLMLQKADFDPAKGVDVAIVNQAESEGDTLVYLETAVFQIEMLASLDEDEMFANVDTTVDQFAEFDAVTARLLQAWRSGDVEGLEEDITEPLRQSSPQAFATIFTDRNKTWADEIEALMKKSDDYFVAVGAGHLVGRDGVIAMLAERGLAVERVQ